MARTYLVVGAGFTGAVLAERIASQLDARVILIDRRSHVGGNAYDNANEVGVVVHRYGPHVFHTNAPRVVRYLSRFTEWRPYEHRVRGLVEGRFVPLPFNLTSIELVFGRQEGRRLNKLLTDEFGADMKIPILSMRGSGSRDIRKVADFIYERVFLHYTTKHWGLSPEELDPGVSARLPVRLSHDDRYFEDSFQQMPASGFASMFKRMLDHTLIEVRTDTRFEDIERTETFDHVVFTGPIDEFFQHRHGPLPYRSIQFDHRSSPALHPVQSAAVENYPTPPDQHAFTRCTEFRLLTGQDDIEWTTRAFEFPQSYVPGVNEPYYPIPKDENWALLRKYLADADKLRTVTFVGRLADYAYYNMDQAVGRALACFEKEIVPLAKTSATDRS